METEFAIIAAILTTIHLAAGYYTWREHQRGKTAHPRATMADHHDTQLADQAAGAPALEIERR